MVHESASPNSTLALLAVTDPDVTNVFNFTVSTSFDLILLVITSSEFYTYEISLAKTENICTFSKNLELMKILMLK